MMRSTHLTPVSGRAHLRRIFFPPFFVTCSMVTIKRLAEATRSIAPPIPLTIAPGTIQLALSHCSVFDPVRPRRHAQGMDEDARRVDAVRMELAGLDQFFHFDDADFSCGGGHRIEIAGGLAIDEIAQSVAAPRGDE